MAFSYTISETNIVNIFSDTQSEPVIIQPNWPNGTAWANSAEAESWAQLCIAAMEDPSAPDAPAGPGVEGENKPSS